MLKCQYQLTEKSRETLNLLNKHATVKPMSVIICLLWTVSIDSDIQSDINQTIMHFVRSVHKNDNINCEFSCMALHWLI